MEVRATFEEALKDVTEAFPFADYVLQNTSPHRTVWDVLKKYAKKGDRVYDFGAGPGDKTAFASMLGCTCTAYDDLQDNWHNAGDNREKILGFLEAMEINFEDTFIKPAPKSFEIIMLNDVLEHLHISPRYILTDLIDGLSDGGLLFITVPNLANLRKRLSLLRGRTNLPRFDLYYWYDGPWRGPVREYVRGDLEGLVRHLKLEMVELSSTHHMLKNLPSSLQPIYKGVTALFPNTRDSWVLVARKPAGWTAESCAPERSFEDIYGERNESVSKLH